MRRVIFNFHLYVALAAAAFAVVLSITGIVVAFETELDHVWHWKLSYVTPLRRTLTLADIGTAASSAFPGEPVRAYEFSSATDLSYQVRFPNGIVFVNPYTGAVLGKRTAPDLVSTFLRTVHRVHVSLVPSLGEAGGTILSWACVAVVFLLLSGLYLWWPIKRVLVKRGTKGRRFWFDLHNAAGVFSLPFILVLGLTGMAIGFNRTAVSLVYRITGFQAPPAPDWLLTVPTDRPISPDAAVAIARAALPGAAPFDIGVPAQRGNYQIRMRYPEDRTPGGRSHVVVDQYSGRVLVAQSSRAAPAATRIVNANRAIHTGDVFGRPTKIVMALSCLLLLTQVLSGAMMWWSKMRSRGRSRMQ